MTLRIKRKITHSSSTVFEVPKEDREHAAFEVPSYSQRLLRSARVGCRKKLAEAHKYSDQESIFRISRYVLLTTTFASLAFTTYDGIDIIFMGKVAVRRCCVLSHNRVLGFIDRVMQLSPVPLLTLHQGSSC